MQIYVVIAIIAIIGNCIEFSEIIRSALLLVVAVCVLF